MGYNAFVVCNCYKEGKTTAPPYKEFLYEDEEGLGLELKSIHDQDKTEYYQRHQEFDAWKQKACPHENLELANERLANSSGMTSFKAILHDFGGEKRFPILIKYLPTSNDGNLPSECAEMALKELCDLQQEPSTEKKIVLRLSTGELRWTTNLKYSTIFLTTGFKREQFGLDKDGFFILAKRGFLWFKATKLVFRSKHFKQIPLENNKVQFIDTNSQKTFTCTPYLYSETKDSPRQDFEFYVRIENALIADEYQYIIEPLIKLTTASMASGNPIIWC